MNTKFFTLVLLASITFAFSCQRHVTPSNLSDNAAKTCSEKTEGTVINTCPGNRAQ